MRRPSDTPASIEHAAPRGEHICWTYGSDREHERVLTTFLLEGLAHGERICYFGFGGSEARVIEALRSKNLDVPMLLRTEHLIVGNAIDAYTPDGSFAPAERLNGFEDLAGRTLDEGFHGLRVAAETAWLLDDPQARAAWPGYELGVDLLTARMPITGMCSFDTRGTDTGLLRSLAGLHRSSLGVIAGSSTFRIHALGNGTLAIDGVLDASNASILEEAAATADIDAPLIDLGDLEFADPDGVRAVARLVEAIEARHEAPQLTGVSPAFRRLWRTLDRERSKRVFPR